MKNRQLVFIFSTTLISLLMLVPAAFEQGVRGQNKETIDNQVPKHLPIKVEILYGKRAEVLENAEIKVTNTGKRPIYSLHFQVSTHEDAGLPMQYGISSLYLGRPELRTYGNLANADDPVLKPGEILAFTLTEESVRRFREGIQTHQQAVPKKYKLVFQFLGFGDDTGFSGTTGAPHPSKKEQPFVNATDRKPFFFNPAN